MLLLLFYNTNSVSVLLQRVKKQLENLHHQSFHFSRLRKYRFLKLITYFTFMRFTYHLCTI